MVGREFSEEQDSKQSSKHLHKKFGPYSLKTWSSKGMPNGLVSQCPQQWGLSARLAREKHLQGVEGAHAIPAAALKLFENSDKWLSVPLGAVSRPWHLREPLPEHQKHSLVWSVLLRLNWNFSSIPLHIAPVQYWESGRRSLGGLGAGVPSHKPQAPAGNWKTGVHGGGGCLTTDAQITGDMGLKFMRRATSPLQILFKGLWTRNLHN